MGRLVSKNEHYQLLTQYPKGRCVIHKPCLSIFAESVYRLILFFNASNTRLMEVQKIRIRIEKTHPTKTGTLRILHSSLSHSLIGQGANNRRSFENAKLHRKLEIPSWWKRVLSIIELTVVLNVAQTFCFCLYLYD